MAQQHMPALLTVEIITDKQHVERKRGAFLVLFRGGNGPGSLVFRCSCLRLRRAETIIAPIPRSQDYANR